MYHIKAHLPEMFSDVKNSVQNVANVIAAQVAVARDKDLAASFKTDIFANDPMRDDCAMPVGADPIMAQTESEEPVLAPMPDLSQFSDEPEMTKEEADKLVEDFFSQLELG